MHRMDETLRDQPVRITRNCGPIDMQGKTGTVSNYYFDAHSKKEQYLVHFDGGLGLWFDPADFELVQELAQTPHAEAINNNVSGMTCSLSGLQPIPA